MEDITDADHTHTKRVCEDFEIKNQENIMTCMFKAIRYCQLMYLRTLEMYHEIYETDLTKFLPAPEKKLVWQAALKRPN